MGPWLARQRELRGIELHELARITRIPIRSLERLESGALDARPDGFTRGFVRTVAVAIGLDPDDAVARLLPEPTPRRGIPVASLKRWLGAFSLLVVVLASGYLAVRVVTSWTPTEVISPDLRPRLRRDPVRELAEARGLIPPRAGVAPASIDAGDSGVPPGEDVRDSEGPAQPGAASDAHP